jgi:hypothetical protein
MRLLILSQGRGIDDQPGFQDGARRLLQHGVLTAVRTIPYGTADRRGWAAVWDEAAEAVRDMAADAVLLQHFHTAMPDPTAGIVRLRSAPSAPLIAVTSGDPFGRFLGRPPASLRIGARLADLTFLTEMGAVARALVRGGARRVTLMPNGFCQVRFDSDLDERSYRPDFDVAFVGNRIPVRNPARYLFYAARQRERQVLALARRYGARFALFGAGWEGWPGAQGAVAYDRQHEVYRRARVIVGPFPNGRMDYYMSDRAAIAIRSGTPLVDVGIPRVGRIFEDGRHWILHRGLGEMEAACDRLLGWSDAERLAFGRRAASEIAARHSQYHRLHAIVRTIAEVRRERVGKPSRPASPVLDYFLPGTDIAAERAFATAGWP